MEQWNNIFKLEQQDIRTIYYNGNFGRLQVIEDTKKQHYNLLSVAELITREQYLLLYKQLTEFVKAEFIKEAERYSKMF